MDEVMEDAHPWGWERLPFELHRKILQMLTYDELKSKLLAEYAVVCKSWQTQVEEINFQELAIKHGDIIELESIVEGPRRTYLKRVWLKIELDKYAHRLRLTPENEEEQESNNFKFTMALFDLFQVLEQWDTPDFWRERHGRGLELELSAYSPSDKKNLFGEAGLDMDGNSRYFDSLLDFYLLAIPDPQGIHGLPMVNVVTAIHILRRNYRNFSAMAITPILRSLPRLEEVRLEPWQQPDIMAQEDVDSEFAGQIPLWPTHLRRISFFEHFGAFERRDAAGVDTDERRYRFLAQGLRRLSVNLEELSVSFMINAEHFFEPFIKLQPRQQPQPPLPHWPRLRWITLTASSGAMSNHAFPDEINRLLRGAGHAAKNMPQLQSMELYNATWHGAGVFRYLVYNNIGIISWTSTWEFKLGREVKTVWRQVALQHTRQQPIFFDEVKMDEYVGGPEGFIHSDLATREMVLHAVSSRDMMEGRSFPQPVLKLRSTTSAQAEAPARPFT
ncbi:hypothetical protein N0V82_005441 [Gnomoniopsis sp. IMI 355080]|nr:hypothetical protein N0V82_005441 [Gnomoniopsis sp. IMI 355080]